MKRRGFSLIETLIALALATVLIPLSLSLYSSYRIQFELAQRARRLDLFWSVLEHDTVFEGQNQVLLTGQEERQVFWKFEGNLSGVSSLRRYRRSEDRR